MTAPGHILTVTKVADDVDDDVEFSVTCPGLSQSCTVWYECSHEECRGRAKPWDATGDDEGIEEYEAHGEHHQWIEDFWSTASSQCAFVTDWCYESLGEIAQDKGVGAWQVEIEYVGDGEWTAHFLGEA